MSKDPEKNVGISQSANSRSIDELAAMALSVVASRSLGQSNSVSVTLIQRLLEAVMERSKETYRVVTRHMLAMGITAETIVDEYIPAVARMMGDEWCDDVSSFAEVTRGASRLQALLRELSTFWPEDPGMDMRASSALIVMPEQSQHTLGASVMAAQMRRAGVSVQIAIGIDSTKLTELLRQDDYSAVFVSASVVDSLDKVQQLVRTAKKLDHSKTLPVVVGGPILDHCSNILDETGADLATMDIGEALNFCGIA